MRTVRVALLLVSVAAIAHAATAAPAQDQFPRYTLQVIESVPGGVARAINDKGDVLIWSYLDAYGLSRSYVWSAGKATDIGGLADTGSDPVQQFSKGAMVRSMAYAMNDKCQVVGESETSNGGNHAFLWEAGKMRDLGALGGKTSCAQGINNLGQVVGYYENTKGERRAFIWEPKRGIRDLGVPTRENSAIAINDRGQVVGFSYTTLSTFLWEKNRVKEAQTQPVGRLWSLRGREYQPERGHYRCSQARRGRRFRGPRVPLLKGQAERGQEPRRSQQQRLWAYFHRTRRGKRLRRPRWPARLHLERRTLRAPERPAAAQVGLERVLRTRCERAGTDSRRRNPRGKEADSSPHAA